MSEVQEIGIVGASVVALILGVLKIISKKGLFCRTPCGSEHDCFFDINDGRPDLSSLESPGHPSKSESLGNSSLETVV